MTKTILKAAFGLLVLASLLILPKYVESPYALHMMILLFLSVSQGQSWNILGGYAGQHSVGHAAYFGVGAYATMMLMHTKQIAPWYGVWAGIVIVVVVALAIGSICFRLRGPYFVLASIAVAEILRLSAINLTTLTNGAEGILATELPVFKIGETVITDFLTKVPFYYIGLFLALLTIGVTYWVQHSKLGYYFQAIREDQDAAHSLGIHISVYKNIGLVISAILTSLAGSFYGIYVGFVDPPTVLGLDVSVQIMLICIIGGMGTLWGPVLGSLILVPLSEALRSNMITEGLVKVGLVGADTRVGLFLKENLSHAHVLLYGVLVVLVILFMPDGLMGFVKKLATRRKQEAV
ncbi:MAG: branched-chain amino acid transporter rane protein [Holophagaceae bacterium]|nr:branched-chain amino acid transporter rane protein [Holophagaceae bacterium]